MKTEQEIVNEYPDMYELWHQDEFDGPAPQIAVYGFQHGDGWNTIIESLCEQLDRLDVEITVVQQKEKYGGLRFYHNGVAADEERDAQMALGAIKQAEEMSFHVCEQCGAAAEIRTEGWYRTLCDECWTEVNSRVR